LSSCLKKSKFFLNFPRKSKVFDPDPRAPQISNQIDAADNNHEEVDTLLIYHAVLASQRNPPDTQLISFTPDSDFLVLVTANYDLMLKNTSISMASGVVRIDPIWRAIGAKRANAFPAFHAFTGVDNSGRFSRIGKATWLQVHRKADREVISSLQMLSKDAEVTETMWANLASFVYAACSPKASPN